MKKLLLVILILLSYSCCTNKATLKPVTVVESPKPEPKPEPKKIYKMTAPEKNYNVERDKIERDRVERERNESIVPVQDGTIVRNLHSITGNKMRMALISSDQSSFDKGDINYVVQDTMIIGVVNEVNVTISKGVDIKTIIKDVKTFTESNLHTDSIRISPIMRARLIDPSNGVNFIVTPKTNSEQFLEVGDYTRWTWDVTPLKKGNDKLSLVVDVMYGDKIKSYQVYDGIIYVYSNETFFEKITKFIRNNWQFILSSLLIPFGVFLYTKYKKKKR